jgi:hypothetical protein
VNFSHKYNEINSQDSLIDMNDDKIQDSFGIIKPVIDNRGHVIALDKENIKLPYGYKTIETEDGIITAENSKDSLKLVTNEWLNTKRVEDEETKEIKLRIEHTYTPENPFSNSEDIDLNTN